MPTRCEPNTAHTSPSRASTRRSYELPIHDRTREAGLQLEGFSTEEPLEQVVATIARACEGPSPGRDVAVTRGGRAQMAVARHLPRFVDRIVARTLAKRIAAGDLDDAEIAAGLRARHKRT